MDQLKLAFIGAGRMGEALLKGILTSRILKSGQVIISDVRSQRLSQLQRKYKVRTTRDNVEAVKFAEAVVLAVKPQQLDYVLEEITDFLSSRHIVVSIAAGVATERILKKVTKKISLVRVMPNSPALVGAGISVVSPSKLATKKATEIVSKLFSSVGEVILLEEKYQNLATALSGSGPAYFCLFIEALIDAGIEIGLDQLVSSKLAIETLAGSAKMLKEAGMKPKDLREMVTSPGGTTAAALKVFDTADFSGIVDEAVKSAVKRAEELG